MPLYVSACDALLLTSEREASPTIVKEALASNVPVVSFDVGDVAECLWADDGCWADPKGPSPPVKASDASQVEASDAA
jgi:glycosyltransferase involved in cell wall biosynthesis